MAKNEKPGRFMYSRTLGVYSWFCPHCEEFNRSHLTRSNWWAVQCSHCDRKYIRGDLLVGVAQGTNTHRPPPDQVLIYDIHPDKWRLGQPANRFIDRSDTMLPGSKPDNYT